MLRGTKLPFSGGQKIAFHFGGTSRHLRGVLKAMSNRLTTTFFGLFLWPYALLHRVYY